MAPAINTTIIIVHNSSSSRPAERPTHSSLPGASTSYTSATLGRDNQHQQHNRRAPVRHFLCCCCSHFLDIYINITFRSNAASIFINYLSISMKYFYALVRYLVHTYIRIVLNYISPSRPSSGPPSSRRWPRNETSIYYSRLVGAHKPHKDTHTHTERDGKVAYLSGGTIFKRDKNM